jgi:ABC-type molybdate transport system substrate-binding protein
MGYNEGMQRFGITLLLLLCTTTFFGCGPKETPQLYIYCNETFWYVMQEEALFFNKIYGFQIFLIPVRADRTSKQDSSVKVGTDSLALAQWLGMSEDPIAPDRRARDPHAQINSDIKSQIESISASRFGDLFLSDSTKQHDKIREDALSTNEFPVCYLTLTMLVQEDNPYRFRSIKDVLESNRQLGIVDPSIDGLGEASWKVLGKIAGSEAAIPMDCVRLYERQYDLLEALEEEKNDAALVWNATNQVTFLLVKYVDKYNAANEDLLRAAERRKDWKKLREILQNIREMLIEDHSFAEEVPLTENPNERCVVAVPLVALGTATNYGHCVRFADYIRSKRGKDVLQRFGFVTE